MELSTPSSPQSRSLRLAEIGLTGATWLLVLAAVIGLPAAALIYSGRGTLHVDAELEPPFTLVLDTVEPNPTSRSIGVTDAGPQFYTNFERGEGKGLLGASIAVRDQIKIADGDRDSRIIVILTFAVGFALLALIVLSLRLLVADAVRGDPFSPANARRLQIVAAAAAGLRVLTAVSAPVLGRTIEMDTPHRIVDPGPGFGITAAVVIALLALAEVFRAGARLRESESLTI